MPLLTAKNACLAYGHVPLLDHAELQLDAGERVALIGRNGSGKSSLLAALAGERALDDGELWRAPALKLAYVAQEPELAPEQNVYDTVVSGLGESTRLLAAYHALSQQLAQADSAAQPALLERLHDLQGRLETLGGWSVASQAERVIARFGLDAEGRVATLSGGQKKRLALARALVAEPQVLLLDEPTNHLDIAAIEWLEELLLAAPLTLLFITHDRRFLEKLATRIVELDRGRLTSFPGNFAAYRQRKESLLAEEAQLNAKFDKFLAQEEVWIRKGVEARRTRNEGRVRRLERLRVERAARRERAGQVRLALDAGEKSGQLVAELSHVCKAYGEGAERRVIVQDLSCRILRGDRVGLIGPNGAGKTTLLKLILGELKPDSGTVRQGTRLATAYFDQFRAQLDGEASLADVISPGSDYVEINGERKHVTAYLEDFLFPPSRARAPVKSLSGGEKNRLLLARLFARPANVLVLDEPTNDLDMETLELLESLLQDYTGTLFLVSHDRAFLDNVVTQTLVAEGGGLWREYVGGYEDWLRQRTAPIAANRPAVAAAPAPGRAANRPAKLSYKDARELEQLPARIDALETEQRDITERLQDPALHVAQADEAARLAARLDAIEAELLQLLERWEALEAHGRNA